MCGAFRMTGEIRTLIGSNGPGMRDGPVQEAQLQNPRGICLCQNSGDILIADTGNHLIRRLSHDLLTLITVVGTGGRFGHVDGDGKKAMLSFPVAVVELPPGAPLSQDRRGRITKSKTSSYIISDSGNHCLRLIERSGDDLDLSFEISLYAGRPKEDGHANGRVREGLIPP